MREYELGPIRSANGTVHYRSGAVLNRDRASNIVSSEQSSEHRPGLEAAMLSELDHVLRDRSFVKSPTLSKLLAFLVFETLNGNGDKLKSYTVAVDCLGKDANFDPQTDSYPRVQTMRLRKLLEAFYAKHAPQDKLCLYMIVGSYRVRMGQPETAYPELFRPLSADRTPPPPAHSEVIVPEPFMSGGSNSPSSAVDSGARAIIRNSTIIIFVMMGLLIATLLALRQPEEGPAPSAVANNAPFVVVNTVESSNDDVSEAAADDIFAKLADGIGKSWAVRVRLPEGKNTTAQDDSTQYRLETRLGEIRDGQRTLYLRLTDDESSELIWSGAVLVDPVQSLSDSLGPSIAQVASPFGVVASRELQAGEGKPVGEYGCLLRYLTHLRTQNVAIRPALLACLEKPYKNERLNAVRLALLSFFTLETSTPQNQQQRLEQAKSLTLQSIGAYPAEAYAHFAKARLQYVSANCVAGNMHTLSAVQLNPYDPVILAVLGNFAAECGLTKADALVDRAFALRAPGESFARLSLVLASIRDGRTDRLFTLSSNGNVGPSSSPAYHYLCETLIAAALDEPALARRNWQLFVEAAGNAKHTTDQMLRQILISQRLRNRVVGYLVSKGVLQPQMLGLDLQKK